MGHRPLREVLGTDLMTDANRVWFTSDTHFAHAKIIQHSNRPWKHVDDMNAVLIDNWNKYVKKGDDVFHLGDFAWKDAAAFRPFLNGNIHLNRGNHESAAEKIASKFIWLKDVADIKLRYWVPDDGIEGGIAPRTQFIFLSHYAHLVWPRSHHGVWHLYGHSHGSLPEQQDRLSMDVGVDATARRLAGIKVGGKIDFEYEEMVGSVLRPEDYRPISFEEVKNAMSRRHFNPVDHHSGVVSHSDNKK